MNEEIMKIKKCINDPETECARIDCCRPLIAEIERLEKENKNVRIDGVKHERGVWVGFILGTDERVRKYWEGYRNGDEFSADDAATITQMMMDDIDKLQRVCDCVQKLTKNKWKYLFRTIQSFTNTEHILTILKELQQALREIK